MNYSMITHWLALLPIFIKRDMCSVFILFTSVNYWRNPKKGFRRNIDIATVVCTGVYKLYTNPLIWKYTIPMSIVTYSLSNYYKDRRIHSFLHVYGCVSVLLEKSL
jgi:hypothetical protein